ncbi:GNAT family N-acetyltransferase [Streptomyces sp. NPDC058045]|uniref:GNAT family N-acetyltransferase n=1 Tax=Streptomyces sp. NPDC058045 TaxID=3346311 RepID=UPI0036E4910A
MSTPSLSSLPVRRLTPQDRSACADLSEDRGWPREDHKWGLLLTAGQGYGIDAPEGGLVSACVVTSYGAAARPELQALGMMLVAERYARRGVGRRLLSHVIAEADGAPLTLYATETGRPLYEQLGFKMVGRAEMVRGRFSAASPDGAQGATAGGIRVRPATAEDLPAMLALDLEVFGTDRTLMLTRLPAFADLLRVAEAGDELIGFAAAWPNEDTHVLGPLVARDPATAQALITALAQDSDRDLRTDIDVQHGVLLDWLKDCGLRLITENAVMALGIPKLPGDWRRRFAPLTVAAG